MDTIKNIQKLSVKFIFLLFKMAYANSPTVLSSIYNEENFQATPSFLLYQTIPASVYTVETGAAGAAPTLQFYRDTLPRFIVIRGFNATFTQSIIFDSSRGVFPDGTVVTITVYSGNPAASTVTVSGSPQGSLNAGVFRAQTASPLFTAFLNVGRQCQRYTMVAGVWTQSDSRVTF